MLETDRMNLRRPRADDLPLWRAYFLSERAVFQGGGATADEGLAWRVFSSFLGHWELNGCGPFTLAQKADDTAIGLVGPWFPSNWPERELTWSIWRPDLEGRGYAFEAVKAVATHVFRELRWSTAVSYIDPQNTKSLSLAERLGCFHDVGASTPGGDGDLVYRHVPDGTGGS